MTKLELVCKGCGVMFIYERARKGGGRVRSFCDSCGSSRREASLKKAMDSYREKKGQKVGVGSGGNQWGEKNPLWKGGHSLYRKTCLLSHGEVCVHCGSGDRVVAHHINENRSDGSPENLRPVCWKCHQNVEHRGLEFRDEKGRYKSRSKTAEKIGEASRRGNPT